jgi:hypothetical protein
MGAIFASAALLRRETAKELRDSSTAVWRIILNFDSLALPETLGGRLVIQLSISWLQINSGSRELDAWSKGNCIVGPAVRSESISSDIEDSSGL